MNETIPYLAAALLIVGVAAGIYVALIAAAHTLRKRYQLVFGWTYHLFSLATGVLVGVTYAPRFLEDLPLHWSDGFLNHLTAAVIILAVFPVVKLLNRLLWARSEREGTTVEAPRVLADTTGLVVFIAVALAVLQFIYQVKVPGLLAGSGVVAIILGLAMQDLLGNVFGGLSIYFEKPFKTGDWLQVEGKDGKVVEMSWRSTRLVTNDDILIDVPNSLLVKQTITNYQKPTPAHALRACIGLHYSVPPERAQAVLRKAAASAFGVLKTPAPVVWVHEFADSSIVYDIKFWIDDHRLAPRILSEVRSHAWYAVRRAGMEIPFPIVTLNRPVIKDTEAEARAVAANALREHEIFRNFQTEHIDRLVRHSPVVLFAESEHVIDQGALGDSMFLVVRGRLEVQLARGTQTQVVATFSPGDCFGEMSLLTGEPRTATVVALEEVEALEITHAVLTPLVQENPEVLHGLSDLLSQRQAANVKSASQESAAVRSENARAHLLRNLRKFFHLGG
jgi:small-conductance mechanosensitive channel/CRP-like cAMP-binding protein